MNLFKNHIFITLLCIGNLSIVAQDIPIHTWRTHFSYRNAKHLVKTDSKIYCATELGLFSLSLLDNEINKLSKMDGLSDYGVGAMEYDADKNLLIIAYQSGIIDFVYESEIKSLLDIANSNLNVSKHIYDIYTEGGISYFATGLGIIVVNNQEKIIIQNYIQVGNQSKDITAFEVALVDNWLVVRTQDGVQAGDMQLNLLNFNNWIYFDELPELKSFAKISNTLFAVEGIHLFQFTASEWKDTGFDLPQHARVLLSSSQQLFTISTDTLYKFEEQIGFQPIKKINIKQVNDMEVDGNRYFFADDSLGLTDDQGNQRSPTGPHTNQFSKIKVVGDTVYGFNAPKPDDYNENQKNVGYSIFDGHSWKFKEIENFWNISDVARLNGNHYFSSTGYGLYAQNEDKIWVDLPSISIRLDHLVSSVTSYGGQLWLSLYGNEISLVQLDQQNQWTNYPAQIFGNKIFDAIDITTLGNLWLTATDGTITYFDPTQGYTRIFTRQTNDLPAIATDVAISSSNDVWVTTKAGPIIFLSASFANEQTRPFRPSFENRNLFSNENVNTVLLDGGDRIWFGLNNGLWLFDKVLDNVILQFTKENSFLPSDHIISLAYNEKTGEVFILTSKGLVSFRSSSSRGTPTHNQVNIFPNPVSNDYEGVVGISGLASNSLVKITDVYGNLLHETFANGSTASWDLINLSGKKVVTGVYLIFSTSEDGVDTYVGKMAVIR